MTSPVGIGFIIVEGEARGISRVQDPDWLTFA